MKDLDDSKPAGDLKRRSCKWKLAVAKSVVGIATCLWHT